MLKNGKGVSLILKLSSLFVKQNVSNGATVLSKTLSIMTFSIMIIKFDTQHNDTSIMTEHCYADFHLG
jgi:hypothetical protein